MCNFFHCPNSYLLWEMLLRNNKKLLLKLHCNIFFTKGRLIKSTLFQKVQKTQYLSTFFKTIRHYYEEEDRCFLLTPRISFRSSHPKISFIAARWRRYRLEQNSITHLTCVYQRLSHLAAINRTNGGEIYPNPKAVVR